MTLNEQRQVSLAPPHAMQLTAVAVEDLQFTLEKAGAVAALLATASAVDEYRTRAVCDHLGDLFAPAQDRLSAAIAEGGAA